MKIHKNLNKIQELPLHNRRESAKNMSRMHIICLPIVVGKALLVPSELPKNRFQRECSTQVHTGK
jgi:hypothetical protein